MGDVEMGCEAVEEIETEVTIVTTVLKLECSHLYRQYTLIYHF